MKNMNRQRGVSILGLIFLAVIIFLVLSYFHLNIQIVKDNAAVSQNMGPLGGSAMNLWNQYFIQPVTNFYNNVVLPFLKPIISKVTSQPTTNPSP